MSFEGGSPNGSEKTRNKPKVVKSFTDLGGEKIIKPRKGPSHKDERRLERAQQKNNLPQLTRSASLFKSEIEAELDAILRRAGIESGEVSTELRRESTQFEIGIDIKDTHIPDSYDLKYAADKVKSHIESDPRNPHGVTVLIRISRARDKNRESLERGGPTSPHLNAEARREMMQKELEKMHDLLDKLAEQLKRDGFTPGKERREIYFRTTRTQGGQEIYEVAIDNEDVPQSIQNTVHRLALIETRILTGSRVLVQNEDGKVVIESRELGARIEGATEKAGAAKENLDNLKAELFPKLRPRLKEFALAVGTAPLDTEESRMLSRIISVQVIEALDDILRLEKSTGKKGKEQARTNMIGGTALFNRLQKLGLIDETGSQVNAENVVRHITQYLESGSGAKDNFIIALHNISARFQRTNRERAFPRTREALEKKMIELGLRLESVATQNTETPPPIEEPWRLALGIHPDADGEGVPRILRRPLGPNPNPIVTAEFAAVLRDMDAIQAYPSSDNEESFETEPVEDVLSSFRSSVSELERELNKLGSRTPEQAVAYIEELVYEKEALQTRLKKVIEENEGLLAEVGALKDELTSERQSSGELERRAIDAETKTHELTEELQRAEARQVVFQTLFTELQRIGHDPKAVRELADIASDALRTINEEDI